MYKLPLRFFAPLFLFCANGCGPQSKNPGSAVQAVGPAVRTGEPATARNARRHSTNQFQAVSEDLGPREGMPGAALYAEHCAACHEGGVSRSPTLNFLEVRTPQPVYASMTNGIVQPQADHLS